jgi:tripartite-type tricarboxylate transporter receptor subunit TctC
MDGVRLLPLPQHLIHLSSQFAAPKPNLPILGSYHLAAGAAAFPTVSRIASAQTYPNKTITIVVPGAAGGPTDTVTRLIAESMSRRFARQIVVENIGGSGGTLGATRVATAPADGYTLLLWHIGLATAASLYHNLRYDTIKGFESIGRIADVPMTIVGRQNLSANSISELLAFLKERQRNVTYAHAGVGSASHLCGLMLMSALNAQLTTVSYRGTGPAMNDLLGGHVDVMCDQTTNTANPVKEGRIKGYAVTTGSRISALPDLPTLGEVGLMDFDVSAWHALWAPKGTPKDVVEKRTCRIGTPRSERWPYCPARSITG